DRAPQRITAADAFAELQDAALVDTNLQRGLWVSGHADQLPMRIGNARLAQPAERRVEVGQGLERAERLRRNDNEGRRWIKSLHRLIERRPVDVRQELHVELRRAPLQCIDEQRGTEQ